MTATKQAQFFNQEQANEPLLIQFVCEQAAQAYQAQRTVFIYAHSSTQAEQIDEQLWCFEASSFVPHHIIGEGPKVPPPVRIGFEQNRVKQAHCLINLSGQMLENAAYFEHIIDFVPQDDAGKTAARERFKQYRQAGFNLSYHPLPTTELTCTL